MADAPLESHEDIAPVARRKDEAVKGGPWHLPQKAQQVA